MDKLKLRSEVLSTVNQALCNADSEQSQTSKTQVSEEVVIAELEIDSLELIALTEVLERKFNLGYIEVENLKNLTVGQLCDKIVYSNLRQEVKKNLLKLLHKMDKHTDYSGVYDEERIFWDHGFDSMDIQDLTLKIEDEFGVDLAGFYLGDYTFGEVVDLIAERL